MLFFYSNSINYLGSVKTLVNKAFICLAYSNLRKINIRHAIERISNKKFYI